MIREDMGKDAGDRLNHMDSSDIMSSSIILENPLLRKEKIEIREYQVKIAESSIGRNTLVVLPTALGKTVIAVCVSAYYLYIQPNCRILVMAPTRPLVNQHKEKFAQLLRLEAHQLRILTGDIAPEERKLWWRSRDVMIFFTTPEVVKNDLEDGLSLDNFSLIVFDEAHRARKEYAYTKVAKHYVSSCKNPRILALTASPGSDANKVREIVNKLFIENIIYRSEYDRDVAPYIHNIKIEYKMIEPPVSYQRIANLIREMLEDCLAQLREAGLINKDCGHISRRELLEVGEKIREKIKLEKNKYARGLSWNLLLLQNIALILLHELELLLSQGAYTLRKFLENSITLEKKSHRKLVIDPRFRLLMNMVEKEVEEHPKIPALVEELKKYFNDEPNGRVIVFTQYRDTAEHLVDILRDRGFRVEVFVGQRKEKNFIYMSQREQVRTLKRFNDGEIQVLVSTSIGEEGLDIPQCGLVVFYEPITSEIRFIQRRGRTGRLRTGRCVILVAENTSDEVYLESAYRKVKKTKNILEKINQEIKQKNLTDYTGSVFTNSSPETCGEVDGNNVSEKNSNLSFSKSCLEEGWREKLEEVLKKDESMRHHANRYMEWFEQITSTSIKPKTSLLKLSKIIYKRILKMGDRGFPRNLLVEELIHDGYNASEIEKALKKLLKSRRIFEECGRLHPFVKEKLKNSIEIAGDLKRFKICVEELYPGKIVVLVNDRWRAVIPVELNDELISLKKKAEYIVVGKLVRIDGRLHLRLHGVIREL
ncbi:MAG: helicase-related protein [Nitrososphaerota archaeon]